MQIDQRLQACFTAQRNGQDVPPAERYRLEGLLEAAITLGLLTVAEARERVARQAMACCGELPADPATDERVRIPYRQATAPVYPTTPG